MLRRLLLAPLFLCLACAPGHAATGAPAALSPEAQALKQKILTLAQSFAGQGDADSSKQQQLDVLIDKLLAAAPQPPLKERLPLLHGPWKQVWGPYDYRNEGRGVDPGFRTDTIHQVVFPDGYYYNVVALKPDDKKPPRVALLRGEYELAKNKPNSLKVRFTNYPGVEGIPAEYKLHQLPALAERNALPNPTTIVPTIIVRLFFGGGELREVYTDETMRITYGSDAKNGGESVYVMERVEK